MKILWVCSFLILSLAGCTLSNHGTVASNQNSQVTPQLSGNFSPANAVAGSGSFNLTVTGSDFTSTCTVLWNGQQRSTQVVSSTKAIAAIAGADVASAGSATIRVMDTQTGLESNSATFSIVAPATTPTVVSLTIAPTSASLVTGGSVQFTASVTGSSNTAVTWSTTGGTVDTNGLYTAPVTTGTFTVKATSVADSTKSASAAVTVSAAVQHTVTLSWAGSSNASGYNVYRGTVSGWYTKINPALGATTNYVDNTVSSGTTYVYAVTAVSAAGMESAFSSPVTVVVPSP